MRCGERHTCSSVLFKVSIVVVFNLSIYLYLQYLSCGIDSCFSHGQRIVLSSYLCASTLQQNSGGVEVAMLLHLDGPGHLFLLDSFGPGKGKDGGKDGKDGGKGGKGPVVLHTRSSREPIRRRSHNDDGTHSSELLDAQPKGMKPKHIQSIGWLHSHQILKLKLEGLGGWDQHGSTFP